jgi:hypothetical protein
MRLGEVATDKVMTPLTDTISKTFNFQDPV